MSLILDALRRADAQRERDPRRGIHAQSTPLADDDDDEQARFVDRLPLSLRLLPWAGTLVLLLAALVGWREVRQDPEDRAQAQAQAHSLPPLPDSTGPRPVRPAAPATAILPAPAPPTAAPQAAPLSASPPAASTASQGVPARASAAPAASAVRTSSQALPAGLPALTISGSVYASSPKQRMLIVNGQVHGEGAEPVPGVRVEQIQPNAAVLRYRGQRYEVGF